VESNSCGPRNEFLVPVLPGSNLLTATASCMFLQLTDHERNMFRSGAYQFLPNRDRAGRAIILYRFCRMDLSDYRALARCIWYTESVLEDEPAIQQKGVVTVADGTDSWKFSPLQALHFATKYPIDSTPFHDVSLHVLYNDSPFYDYVRRVRRLMMNSRMRFCLHYGSKLETEYALRTFGINISGHLHGPNDGIENSDDGIEESIRKRQQLDEKWLQSEAPYRDPSYPIALVPNPQDIILGRNRAMTMTWSGNIVFHKVIEQHAPRYAALQRAETNRVERTMIALEILHSFHNQYGARFLTRKDDRWSVADDLEVQKKISQALQNSTRVLGSKKLRRELEWFLHPSI